VGVSLLIPDPLLPFSCYSRKTQIRPVHVYILLYNETIEQHLFEICTRRKELDRFLQGNEYIDPLLLQTDIDGSYKTFLRRTKTGGGGDNDQLMPVVLKCYDKVPITNTQFGHPVLAVFQQVTAPTRL